jgi:hypothetical protein
MFWWQGRGIWVLAIGALCILPVEKVASGAAIPLAFAAAAAIIFFLKDWFEGASPDVCPRIGNAVHSLTCHSRVLGIAPAFLV